MNKYQIYRTTLVCVGLLIVPQFLLSLSSAIKALGGVNQDFYTNKNIYPITEFIEAFLLWLFAYILIFKSEIMVSKIFKVEKEEAEKCSSVDVVNIKSWIKITGVFQLPISIVLFLKTFLSYSIFDFDWWKYSILYALFVFMLYFIVFKTEKFVNKISKNENSISP